jgi:hypothetical protein
MEPKLELVDSCNSFSCVRENSTGMRLSATRGSVVSHAIEA